MTQPMIEVFLEEACMRFALATVIFFLMGSVQAFAADQYQLIPLGQSLYSTQLQRSGALVLQLANNQLYTCEASLTFKGVNGTAALNCYKPTFKQGSMPAGPVAVSQGEGSPTTNQS